MKATVTLPENHRRSLSVTARMIEDSLDESEELLRSQGKGKLVEQIVPSFSQGERDRMLGAISRMRDANTEMFHRLDLEPSHRTEGQIIKAKITHMWTILVDSKSDALRGFGELPSTVAQSINSHVDNLLELLEEILGR